MWWFKKLDQRYKKKEYIVLHNNMGVKLNMKIVAVMPIKLKNERCPGKNTKMLGDRPLLQYELTTLKQTNMLDKIVVYCSDEKICEYLISGVEFIKRPRELDEPTSNFNQIFASFKEKVDADIYVYAHATAPFVKLDTMMECIMAVKSGNYDSAFCAIKLQDFLWQNGQPLNFDAENLPRTQDLTPIYQETSGVYVFTKEVFEKYRRRIGEKPYIKEISYKETVDIDTPDDFKLAELFVKSEV